MNRYCNVDEDCGGDAVVLFRVYDSRTGTVIDEALAVCKDCQDECHCEVCNCVIDPMLDEPLTDVSHVVTSSMHGYAHIFCVDEFDQCHGCGQWFLRTAMVASDGKSTLCQPCNRKRNPRRSARIADKKK